MYLRSDFLDVNEAKKTAEMATKTVVELSQNRRDTYNALQGTRQQAILNHKLWKEGNKSRLIEVGLALIALPEPTPVSIIIGSGLVAAGAVKKGIKNQSLYMEDIPKSLTSAFKEIYSQRANFKL
jgi:hypothetical protein